MSQEPKDIARELALANYSLRATAFDMKAFERDFNVFTTSKKMITRFLRTGKMNEKLLINNVILMLNIFSRKVVTQIFRHLLDDGQFAVIKAILMFLRQYDFSISTTLEPNRMMVDILKDISNRYNLEHL